MEFPEDMSMHFNSSFEKKSDFAMIKKLVNLFSKDTIKYE